MNSFFKKILHTSILAVGLNVSAHAQEIVQDFRWWATMELYYDATDNIKLGLRQETRFKNNATKFQGYLFQPSVSYEVISNLTIGAAYRFYLLPESNQHQSFVSASWEQKLYKKILSIEPGLTWQYQFKTPTLDLENRLRVPVQLKYKVIKDRIGIYAGAEPFFKMNDAFNFFRLRLSTGIKVNLNKNARFIIGYMWERNYQNRPNINHTLETGLAVGIK